MAYNEHRLGLLNDFVSSTYNLADTMALLLCGKNGRYLEIGAHKPIKANNTALLELNGWNGISLELSQRMEKMWADAGRKPTIVIADAIKFDYDGLTDKEFDFIQYDIDPAANTFKALYSTIKANLSTKFITYEHDLYRDPSHNAFKSQAREMLHKRGYKSLFENVPVLDGPKYIHEDWYVREDTFVPFDHKTWYSWAAEYRQYFVPHTRKLVR